MQEAVDFIVNMTSTMVDSLAEIRSNLTTLPQLVIAFALGCFCTLLTLLFACFLAYYNLPSAHAYVPVREERQVTTNKRRFKAQIAGWISVSTVPTSSVPSSPSSSLYNVIYNKLTLNTPSATNNKKQIFAILQKNQLFLYENESREMLLDILQMEKFIVSLYCVDGRTPEWDLYLQENPVRLENIDGYGEIYIYASR